MQIALRSLFILILLVCLLPPLTAAQAAGPNCDAAAEGVILYNKTHKVVQFCNGTQWIGMTAKIGAADDTLANLSCASGDVAKWNGAAWACADGGLLALQGSDDPDACTLQKDGLIKYNSSSNPPWHYCDGGTTSWLPFRLPQCQNDDAGECTLAALRNTNDPQFTAANLRCGAQVLGVTGTLGSGSSSAFTFTNATNAALSTLTTAPAVTISGIPAGCPGEVTVSGQGSPQISVAGGAWGTSGTITNGQTLAVRLTSSASSSTAHTATVSIGSTDSVWSVTTLAADTTPNAFDFTPNVTNAALSTLTTASAVTISAINTTAPVSVSGAGAQISINGGAWGTSGNITNGQTLAVRLTSSASFSTAITATVNVGGVTDTWSVTTLPADTTPDAFTFTDQTNVALSTLTASNTITISGINTATPISATGGAEFRIAGGSWVTSGNITNGQTLEVRLTSSASFSTAVSTTVTVGTGSDSWSVTTRAPNNCTAQSKTWLTNCTATVTAAAHGANGTGTIANPGGCGTTWYGSGTFACSDGAFTYSSGSCTQQTACDTTPNAFTFTDVTGANPSTPTTATAVTISGINTSTPVSVTGTSAQISINGGAWGASGNITNGQTLAVRLTSSASFSTAMSATVDVGGVTNAWSVTTRAANNCTVASGTTWTATSQTCTAPSAVAINHGATGGATDATAPTTGSATWSCSDGTATLQAGATCSAAASCSAYTWALRINEGWTYPPDYFAGAAASNGTKMFVLGPYCIGMDDSYNCDGYSTDPRGTTNGGTTWAASVTAPGIYSTLGDVAGSTDGVKLVAAGDGGYIFTSANSAASWTQRTSAGARRWMGVASSDDGTKLAAVVMGGYIYTSTNSGANWTAQTASGSRNWWRIASSADGTKLAAIVTGTGTAYIYTSTNSGVSWTAQTAAGSRNWRGISMSSNGQNLAAAAYGNYVYTSTNGGVNWTARTAAGSRNWTSLKASDNGSRIAASAGTVYVSFNSGSTWAAQSVSGWVSAMSGDADKIVVGSSNVYVGTCN